MMADDDCDDSTRRRWSSPLTECLAGCRAEPNRLAVVRLFLPSFLALGRTSLKRTSEKEKKNKKNKKKKMKMKRKGNKIKAKTHSIETEKRAGKNSCANRCFGVR